MPDDQTLKDRVILVTGATGGLGEVLSLAFAQAGATVVLHGRVVRKLEALFDRIVAAGGPEPAILPLDLEKAGEEAFGVAAAALDAQLGRLDAIVHCAAMLRRLAPIEYHTLEDWSAVLRVNLGAAAALTRALLPALRRAPAGTVIFTLDSRGHEPAAYWGSYAAAKAGLEALVTVLHDEWEASTLAACGIIPGPIDTPMRQRTHPGDESGVRQKPAALVPLYIDILRRGKSASGQILAATQGGRARS
jgi:NAD(P)-dependent dehydrogenase (short-subunit alcohol dehydrogenase family)